MNTTDHTSQPTPPGTPRGEPSPEAAPLALAPLALATSAPLHVILHPAAGSRRRTLMWIGWIGFLTCLVMLIREWSARRDYYDVTDGIRERYHSGDKYSTDKVAIISLRGVILEGDGFMKQQIGLAAASHDTASHDMDPLKTLLEMSAPRAYYLFTALPPLVTSRERMGE